MTVRILFSISLAMTASLLWGQELTELQAVTPEEFDQYLVAEAASTPSARVAAANAFLKRWPRSALAGPVGIWLMEAHRELDQGEAAIRAGEGVIEANRDLVPALITLSELLVNLRTAPVELERATEIARRVLGLVNGGLDVPRSVPLESWLRAKREYEARVWAVVGQAEFKRDRAREALAAFARAVQDEPAFDGARHLRYGLLLQQAGRMAEARRELEAVVRQGPEALRERARAALAGRAR